MITGATAVFILAVMIIYYVCPAKAQPYLLAAAGLVFCAVYTPFGAALLLLEALAAHLAAKRLMKKRSRLLLTAGIVFFVAAALAFKYLTPHTDGLTLIRTFDITRLSYSFGASYFMLRLISFLSDVYAGKADYDGGYFKLLLYLCYFPAVTEGPIERYRAFTGKAFTADKKRLTYENVRNAGQNVLKGAFKLYVLAGYAGQYITVIADPADKPPLLLLYGLAAYSVYIYANFSGGIDIFRGVSYLFGIELEENFRAPYFSQSVKEFWQRWHITFGAWLRDYVYIPLGGNRKGAARKALNVVAVFVVSALWHGVTPAFLVWGLLHAIYQIIGGAFRRGKERAPLPIYLLRAARTFLLVTFSWLFFSSKTVGDALFFLISLFRGSGGLGAIYRFNSLGAVGVAYFAITAIWFILEMIRDRYGFSLFSREKTSAALRWTVYTLMLVCVLAMGFYGEGYDAGSFLYGGF